MGHNDETRIRWLRFGMDNCYFIENREHRILVDTAQSRASASITEMCRQYPIEAIFLTHGHYDHIQNAACLAKEFHVPIFMHDADEGLIRDNADQTMKSNTFMGNVLRWKSCREFREKVIDSFIPSGYLSDNDSLSCFGLQGRIVALLGHTWGSIGIDCGSAGFIVGDALINIPYHKCALIYADKEKMKKSVERIGKMGERILYYGHGKPTKNWVYKKQGTAKTSRDSVNFP